MTTPKRTRCDDCPSPRRQCDDCRGWDEVVAALAEGLARKLTEAVTRRR